jgi:hypothetical protein
MCWSGDVPGGKSTHVRTPHQVTWIRSTARGVPICDPRTARFN